MGDQMDITVTLEDNIIEFKPREQAPFDIIEYEDCVEATAICESRSIKHITKAMLNACQLIQTAGGDLLSCEHEYFLDNGNLTVLVRELK